MRRVFLMILVLTMLTGLMGCPSGEEQAPTAAGNTDVKFAEDDMRACITSSLTITSSRWCVLFSRQ